ncbi:inorganic triphosphatase [Vibrio sp. S11_S32]|uniref:CYTH and CHAD domain-containing protein n=1 Tax=Vibrio sp. S11_S32 TaxID=2720225 RepID=UPI0016817ADF|nr:inorganic triphosphatase [Vibrio sp. S11_S32]MBD1576869.1 inorganic triphosphatase [Vibrio sp. S11_S32]
METEIELKFFVSPDFSSILKSKIEGMKVLQHSCRTLMNLYFDTPDQWLRQYDIGMRIRRTDDVYVQTVKTSGRVVAGLHQRPEFNAEHNSNEPDLSLHPIDIWPEGRDWQDLQNELVQLFETNFEREQWLLSMPDGSQIEVAFDQGVVSVGEQQTPICEVELELKSGQTESLFTLARLLSDKGGMRLGNLSKAARGYRLAQDYQSDPVVNLTLVETQADETVEGCFIASLEHALSHWLYHEQIYAEQDSIAALEEINESISFIRQLFHVYGGIIPRRTSAILRQELKWLKNELLWLKNYQYLDELTEDKGYLLRKLDSQKYLVNELNSLQQALPDRAEMLGLLQSARYTAVLLDLSRWILSRGWQPFLDDKAKQKMGKNVASFAKKQLNRSWQELVEVFPPERSFSCQDYIDQQLCLSRNLYTGLAFASLFELELRTQFRLPWVDLMQGIDDLLTLTPLEQLQDQLDEDQQDQLDRWLKRQEHSILHAMEQTRAHCLEITPYWHD